METTLAVGDGKCAHIRASFPLPPPTPSANHPIPSYLHCTGGPYTVLLVEKIQSRLGRTPNAGDVVLFPPPTSLKSLIASRGGVVSDRDLFVKVS